MLDATRHSSNPIWVTVGGESRDAQATVQGRDGVGADSSAAKIECEVRLHEASLP